MKQATLIYNPVSGSAQIVNKLERFAAVWRARGWEVTIQKTASATHGTELARAAADQNHRVVIAAGGDGTIRDVIRGLLGSDTILVILPCGTGNTFARELHLMRPSWRGDRFTDMATRLLDGTVHTLDVGCCNNELTWFMTLGVGIDALAVQAIEPRIYKSWLSRRFNKLIYAYKGVRSLRDFPGMQATVRVDGRTVRGDFLLITVNNTRLYGGYFAVNPGALLDDGLVEVWMLHGSRKRDMLRHFWRIAMGRQRAENGDVTMLRGSEIEIDVADSFPFQYDGDLGGGGTFRTVIRPQAIQVLVPNDAAVRGLFSAEGERLEEGGNQPQK